MFGVLRGDHCLNSVESSIIEISEEALVHEDIIKEKWIQACHWCEWWMRLPHLKMLCEAFTVNTSRARAPRDTNGVERVNQASKDSSTPGLLKVMENLYKKDKVVGLSYIAAEKCITITYRDQSEESRHELTLSRKRQRQNLSLNEDESEFGPPDKRKNFRSKQSKQSKVKIGQRVEVKYDNDVWYKGTLVEYDNATDEWVALFDEDGDQTKIKFPDEDVRML